MRRRFLIRFLAAVGPLLLLLLLAEAGLKAADRGHPTGFWIRGPVLDGSRTVTDNPWFSWPVFGPRRARLATPFALEYEKPDDVVRVFVLGGSAAQGDPDPSFSCARILEVLLPEAWPGVRFEVVDAAVTAIDSSVVREIAKDVLELDPDILVIYAGNNEFVGPFGPSAGGVARRAASTVRRRLLGFRLGQVVARWGDEWAVRHGKMADWDGMEAFSTMETAVDDPVRTEVLERFENNLRAIIREATADGVGIVLSTVAVNLADCPPFGSEGREDLSANLRAERALLIDTALQAAGSGDTPSALSALDRAAVLDGGSADVEFLRGRVLLAAGRSTEALEAFKRSRDLDRLPFRATSDINRVIRDLAGVFDGQGTVLADVERAMENAAPSGVPGRSFFFEHVHPTFEGNSILAQEIVRALGVGRLPAPFDRPPVGVFEEDDRIVARRLALTPWSQARMEAEILDRIRRPPFDRVMGHEVTVHRQEERLRSLARFLDAEGLRRTRDFLTEAVRADPEDWFHRYNLGILLSELGDAEAAIKAFRDVLAERPTFSMARKNLGRLQLETGSPEAAVATFREVLEIHPYSVDVLTGFGVASIRAGSTEDAIPALERALRLAPDDPTVMYHLALALADHGGADLGRAIDLLTRVVEIDPKDHDAEAVLRSLTSDQ